MAETVKMLSPDKVYLANPDAGCPMAEMMDKRLFRLLGAISDYTVVAYINTYKRT